MSEDFVRAMCLDEEHFEIVRRLGYSSYICVPLIARGRALGTLTLVSCSPGRRFGADDLAIAQEVAWRAALAADNARLFSERAYVARTLQASLLPHTLPDIPGVELAARYLAAGEGNEVGGDFFDAFDVGYGTWAVVVGDVIDLAVGDAVVLYTDGVVEERDDERRTFGQERLRDVLATSTGLTATEIVDNVVGAVTAFSGREPRDDVAVVVLRVVAAT